MPKSSYKMDTRVDTVIILKNLNTNFAPWNLAEVDEDTTNFANKSTVNDSTAGDAGKGASSETIVADDTSESDPANTEEAEVSYYVSRRHLVSASSALDRMISGADWKEGNLDENDSLYHVPAQDWDSEALLYVLQILHLRNGQVPRTIPLEMLAKIAVLIDFYDCAEVLESFIERWIEYLESPLPFHRTFAAILCFGCA
jgi:hypothetical protein